MIFKPMTLEEATAFYEQLTASPINTLVGIAMEDIWYFTNGLTRDYGRVK